jgi:hypothetical protein
MVTQLLEQAAREEERDGNDASKGRGRHNWSLRRNVMVVRRRLVGWQAREDREVAEEPGIQAAR